MVGILRRFDSRRLHFFGHCANRGRDEPEGRLDLAAAVDAEFFDEQPEERFCSLRRGFGDELFEVIGDGGEVGGRGGVCGLVWRLQGEFGLLGAEVVEASASAISCSLR